MKLTKEKADEMRDLPRRAKNGRGPGYSKAEIAEMYGVSVATVKKVLSGDYWK
ncbi:helix-turn-helix domain-containing protein [Modicisalibacter coralii]|uniref:helix-turn-helix domain-containing protein n=1 Tax=Modicisalibacter coralii TaxID=2304602 RepID=UPI0013967B80|nr:helix-turn-helix domain-containing protein [Halomonas coralii]